MKIGGSACLLPVSPLSLPLGTFQGPFNGSLRIYSALLIKDKSGQNTE
jgi:hypothetical protein